MTYVPSQQLESGAAAGKIVVKGGEAKAASAERAGTSPPSEKGRRWMCPSALQPGMRSRRSPQPGSELQARPGEGSNCLSRHSLNPGRSAAYWLPAGAGSTAARWDGLRLIF